MKLLNIVREQLAKILQQIGEEEDDEGEECMEESTMVKQESYD